MQSVNAGSLRGPALKQALASSLGELLGSIEWLEIGAIESCVRSKVWDLRVRVQGRPGETLDLCVVCKGQVSPSQFERIEALKSQDSAPMVRPILAAPRISERVADLCRRAGWGWFDLAGNACIELPGLIYVERTGRKPVKRRLPRTANLGSPEAARVLRAILVPENAGCRWTHRGIIDHIAGFDPPLDPPSLGLINKVVRHLRDEAMVRYRDDGGFALVDPFGMLSAFSRAYRFDRMRQVDLFTLMQPRQLQAALARLDLESGGFAAYAAFSAADRLAPMVRQPKTWVMVAARYERKLRELTESKDVDSGSNLVVMIPEDDGPFYCGQAIGPAPTLRCTSALQTYLDLQQVGGRGVEAAEAVLNNCLKPAWVASGLVEA